MSDRPVRLGQKVKGHKVPEVHTRGPHGLTRLRFRFVAFLCIYFMIVDVTLC